MDIKMNKEAVKVTFRHKVTRDELIKSLDQILNIYGCAGCGLNGWGGIYVVSDPDPYISQIRQELIGERFESVVNVETFNAPNALNGAGIREGF
jgi:hypothetical protein